MAEDLPPSTSGASALLSSGESLLLLQMAPNVAPGLSLRRVWTGQECRDLEIGASYHGWASGPPSPFTRYIVQLPITAEILQIET